MVVIVLPVGWRVRDCLLGLAKLFFSLSFYFSLFFSILLFFPFSLSVSSFSPAVVYERPLRFLKR